MARVFLSITTLDKDVARTLEPRAAAPHRRLQALRALCAAGIPVGVMVAPVIPQLNDKDLEAILEAAADAGATSAGWVMLRLPLEVAPLFREWLQTHYPLRAAHVMHVVNDIRGGRDNDPGFGSRMRGRGPFADLIEQRFRIVAARLKPDVRHVALQAAGRAGEGSPAHTGGRPAARSVLRNVVPAKAGTQRLQRNDTGFPPSQE